MSSPFRSTPEYRHIRDKVKIGIQDVNYAIAILHDGHTPGRFIDSIEVAYTPLFVRRFEEAVSQVEKDFTATLDLANRWFSSVGASISENYVHLCRLREAEGELKTQLGYAQCQLKTADANLKAANARVREDQEHLKETRKQVEKAQNCLDEKLADQEAIRTVTWAVGWLLPLASIPLAIVNTVEESAVQSARATANAVRALEEQDQDVLDKDEARRVDLASQVWQYKCQLHDLEDELSRAVDEEQDLTSIKNQLELVRINAAACMHAVGGAWASANNIGNMLSLTNVAEAIRGLAQALSDESSDIFVGELAALDWQGIQDIDHKAALMAKSRSLLSLSF